MKIVLAAAVWALSAFGAEVRAKTLVFCSEASPEGFDPALYASSATFDASAQPIYNRLVEFAAGSTEIVPGLAERWEIQGDGRVYLFHLRPGVGWHPNERFHPTRGLTVADVLFSFDRQRDPDHPWHGYVEGASYSYYDTMELDRLILQVERVDDLTVRFTLAHPDGAFLAKLAMPFASILSEEYAGTLLASGRMAELNTRPVGTGPFSFVAYQQDAAIRFRRNPDYWGGPPKIDDLIYAIAPDGASRLQKLAVGECDLVSNPPPADLARIAAAPALRIESRPGLNVSYLAYNTQMPPFDDPRVRRALNMAIDKKSLVEAVFLGTGVVASNPIPPDMWSYDETTVDDPHDPERARALLAEAGVTGLRMKIWAMPVQRPYMPNARRAAEMIQADFARIGVAAEIVTYDWAEYLERSMEPGRDGAVLLGWSAANGDPDNFLTANLSCGSAGPGGLNRAFWCDPAFSELLDRARVSSDPAEREALYRAAQAIFKQQAPWATLAHSTQYVAMRANVTGFQLSPFGLHFLATVDRIEPVALGPTAACTAGPDC